MEDFALDVVLGKGPGARTVRLQIEHVTVIGATTRVGSITGPLRDRFGVTYRLDYYTEPELHHILRRSADILGISLTDAAARLVAGRSRGTPRIANRLLRRVRDFALVHGGHADVEAVRAALELYDVDPLGLDRLDRAVMMIILTRFGGGPVGLNTLAVSVGEEAETIEAVVEPFLVRIGLITRTPRGRVATPSAWRHFGLVPEGGERPAMLPIDDL
jgi:Holliday junction DNA helicase RuvB